MDEPNSRELLQSYRDGSSRAATEIFDRYVCRLIALAKARISPKLAPRIDAEDVVQSAYRSFFLRAQSDEITLRRAGDLWRLLAAFTINKLRSQVEHHTAQRRHVDREDSGQMLIELGTQAAVASDEPTPDEAIAIADEMQRIMSTLQPLERRVLQLRLQGATVREISEDVSRSERTVRRLLERIRSEFESRLLGV